MLRVLRFFATLVPATIYYSVRQLMLDQEHATLDEKDHYGKVYGRAMLHMAGIKVEADLSALDPKGHYVFFCNHQSLFDIPILFDTLWNYHMLHAPRSGSGPLAPQGTLGYILPVRRGQHPPAPDQTGGRVTNFIRREFQVDDPDKTTVIRQDQKPARPGAAAGALFLIGLSGCGKSAVAQRVAAALGGHAAELPLDGTEAALDAILAEADRQGAQAVIAVPHKLLAAEPFRLRMPSPPQFLTQCSRITGNCKARHRCSLARPLAISAVRNRAGNLKGGVAYRLAYSASSPAIHSVHPRLRHLLRVHTAPAPRRNGAEPPHQQPRRVLLQPARRAEFRIRPVKPAPPALFRCAALDFFHNRAEEINIQKT